MTRKKSIAAIIMILFLMISGYAYRQDNVREKEATKKIAVTEDVIIQKPAVITAEEVAAEAAVNTYDEYEEEHREEPEVSRGVKHYSHGHEFVITAYDLSVESCGKVPEHPGYGITASGKSLAGHTLESARAIAVDPDVIPMGSKVHIAFDDENMRQYDGVYTAVDTGGAIRGNRIDLYVGEDEHDLAYSIGVRNAYVTFIE